jgi:serine/threonine-protein kinase RsbW
MSLTTASLPPKAAVDVQEWVLDSFVELQQLRAALFVALKGEPIPPGGELEEVPERATVVATELATNALRYGRPPTRVVLRRTEHTFVLDVADEDPDTLPASAGPRRPGAGGMGLHIVSELAKAVGWYVEGTHKRAFLSALGLDGRRCCGVAAQAEIHHERDDDRGPYGGDGPCSHLRPPRPAPSPAARRPRGVARAGIASR